MSWTFGPLPLAGSPTAGGGPSVPSVETWAGAPQSPRRRVRSAAVYALALAFVPLVAAASTDAAPGVQGGAPPSRKITLQYQALTGPVLVPAAGETITLDKWASQPPGLPRRTWRPEGGTTAPVAPVAAPEVVTLDKWQGQAPQRPVRLLRPAGGVVAPLHVPDVTQPVTARSWAPTYPDRIPPRPRAAAFPQAVAPLYVPDVTVTPPLRSWAAVAPDVVRLRKLVPEGQSVAPVLVPAPAETVTVDKWLSPWVARPRVALKLEGGSVAPLHVPDVTQPVTARAWAPTYPDRVPGLRRSVVIGGHVAPVEPVADAPVSLDAAPAVQGGAPPSRRSSVQYQAVTGPVGVPVASAPVAIDWLPTVPARRFDKDGPAIQYAPLTGPVQLVLDLDWLPTTATPRPRAVRPLSGTVAPITLVAEAPVPVQWYPVGPARIARVSPRPMSSYVAPLYVADVTVVAPLRSWAPSLSDVVRRRRLVPTGPVVPVFVPAPAETVTIDKWHAPHVTVVRRVRRLVGGLVAPVVVPDVTVVAPLRSWSPVYPHSTRKPRHAVLVGGWVGPVQPVDPDLFVAPVGNLWEDVTPGTTAPRPANSPYDPASAPTVDDNIWNAVTPATTTPHDAQSPYDAAAAPVVDENLWTDVTVAPVLPRPPRSPFD